MNILTIEKARNELFDFLENSSSRRLKLKKISGFFELILEQSAAILIESYLIEFLPQYIEYLKSYASFGVNPNFTQGILSTNEKLIAINELCEFKEQFISSNERIKIKLAELAALLNGKEMLPASEIKVLFPVIEKDPETKEWVLGAVDSLTIKISRAKESDKFIIVPSVNELDKKLEQQIKISWMKAKEYCAKHIKKMAEYHETIISFDKHLGIYEGNSLGTALTIGFIEELLKFYNSITILKPASNVAFTGAVDENGKIIPLSKEIAERKVEIVFYSRCSNLILHKEDEQYGDAKLLELNKEFPNRKLKIVGVKDLDEILLRRDLVEIKKQKLVVRTGNFVKKNWATAVVTVLLALLFGYLLVVDWDDNPAMLTAESSKLFVKNKNGKTLWVKDAVLPLGVITNNKILFRLTRILDVDNDGKNEVLLAGSVLKNPNITASPGIMCFNNKGEILWKYVFSDQVSCAREKLDSYYAINLIMDTLTVFNHKSLFLAATNANSFSSSIFRIDIRTGKRLPGALWCSGFVVEAAIKDLDTDGKSEILAAGLDNGYEDVVIFSYTPDTLTSSRLSAKDYIIKDFPIANVKNYIRLPKTDFENYIGIRMSAVRAGTFHDKQKERRYCFTVGGFYNENPYGYWAKLDYNLKDFDFVIDNEFRVYRDSLIAKGRLNLPYTDTEEYKQILKSKILYLKDGSWVKREELD